MPSHAMIDIETLDTTPTSIVLSVGAVKFDPFSESAPGAKTLWRPELETQFKSGRTTSDSTLAFWAKQDTHIQESAFSEEGRVPLDDFFKSLNKYLVGVDKIWCHGPQFDMVIIENLYAQCQHHVNWQFWQIMDSRTLFNIMPTDPRKAIQQNLHSAEEDAYWQAVCVQQAYAHFGVTA